MIQELNSSISKATPRDAMSIRSKPACITRKLSAFSDSFFDKKSVEYDYKSVFSKELNKLFGLNKIKVRTRLQAIIC